jgi:hypothetical protein
MRFRRIGKTAQVRHRVVPITMRGTMPVGGQGGRPMRARTGRAGAAIILTAGLVVGCESSRPRAPYADNPLLQSRQPLLQPSQPAGNDQLAQVAQSGPRMVAVPPSAQYHQPATAVAARTATDAPPIAPTYSPPPMSVSPPAPPAPPPVAPIDAAASPLPEPTVPPTLPASVAPTAMPSPAPAPVVRQVEGKYGHSADHTWLQGELDRHYRGHLELRFRPVSEDDSLGGKVRLEDDPRLADFRPGDVIAVEGELLGDPDGANPPWSQYRRFHVTAARLVERKQ